MSAGPARAGRPAVTVIGAGTMGSAVARRLLASGFPVAVWDRTPAVGAALAQSGASVPGDAPAAVAGSEVVLTLLPTAEAVREVMFDHHVVDALAPGAVWVQMGTIGVTATEDLDGRVRAVRADVAFVDAPVSGSRRPAETGELLVLASGPERAHDIAQPVFDAVGRRTIWLGGAGAGSRLKLALNTWLAFEVEAAAEAAAVADRLGVPAAALADAAGGNPLTSPLASAKLAKIQAGDHRVEFPLGWALKDLDLARAEAGDDVAPVAGSIARRWRSLVDDGLGALDVSAASHGLVASRATG